VISIRAQETVSDSPYRLRKGDIVAIDAFETIRDDPYRLRKGDVLMLQVQGTLPGAPIVGPAVVDVEGHVNLDAVRFAAAASVAGAAGGGGERDLTLEMLYGSVAVAGSTREEAQTAIEAHLKASLRQPIVGVFVLRKARPAGVSSEFVIEPDGTVNLDSQLGASSSEAIGAAGYGQTRYGSLALIGRTKDEARQAIEAHVKSVLNDPQVTVSVLRMAGPERVSGSFQIEPEGTVNLDAPLNAQADALAALAGVPAGEERLLNTVTRYGSVPVAGRTREQAQEIIAAHLQTMLPQPQVAVSVLQMAGLQQIAGQHLVIPDGSVTLGSFGSVSVVGMTLADAKRAIESHLSRDLEDPEVGVDVFAYNSKAYYVVFQGAGTGDMISKFPITGNETVLDAISAVGGLQFASSKRVWVARPTPIPGNVQILPVDWQAITAQGAVATNYQLMPGDRLFVAEDKLIALDTGMAKLLAPVERAMGFSMLGVGTVSRFYGNVLTGGGMRGFFGGTTASGRDPIASWKRDPKQRGERRSPGGNTDVRRGSQ
jgi:polysaccharide biosynthesis/export protein